MNASAKAPQNGKTLEMTAAEQTAAIAKILNGSNGVGMDLLVRSTDNGGEIKLRQEGLSKSEKNFLGDIVKQIRKDAEAEANEAPEHKPGDGEKRDETAEAIKAANATKEAQDKAHKDKAKEDAKDEANRASAIAKTIIKQASNACKAKLSDKKGAANALQVEAMRFTGAMAKQAGMKPAELMNEALSWLEETAQDDEATGFSAFFFA